MPANRRIYQPVVGDNYGRLTILSFYTREERKRNRRIAVCSCSCGKQIDVRVNDLQRNRIVSCGCVRKQWTADTFRYPKKET